MRAKSELLIYLHDIVIFKLTYLGGDGQPALNCFFICIFDFRALQEVLLDNFQLRRLI